MDKPTLEELKSQLQELIDSSVAIQEMSDEEKNEQIETMMNADYDDTLEYIQILEEEKNELDEANEELNEHAEEVHEFIVDEQYKEKNELRQQELIKEEELKAEESNKVESLISALEKIDKKEVKKKKLSTFGIIKEMIANFFNAKQMLKSFIASILGLFLCGFGGLLVVYGVLFSMDEYKQFEVAFSFKPLVAFHAYWIAFAFAALIGLLMLPLLRLIKTKSLFLSGILGGIVGAIIVAIAHMLFGLNYDVTILFDRKPLEFRGYWIALIFAILIGFFAQLINRLLNKSKFFKPEEKEVKN